MAIDVKKYSPKQGLLAIGGIPISGYGTGTYIELSFPNNLFNDTEGADGEIALTEMAHGLKTELTIQLLETAKVNDLLWALMLGQKQTKIDFPVLFKDLLGTTVWESSNCWFRKAPNFTKDKDGATNREWLIILPETLGLLGGN